MRKKTHHFLPLEKKRKKILRNPKVPLLISRSVFTNLIFVSASGRFMVVSVPPCNYRGAVPFFMYKSFLLSVSYVDTGSGQSLYRVVVGLCIIGGSVSVQLLIQYVLQALFSHCYSRCNSSCTVFVQKLYIFVVFGFFTYIYI